MPRTSAAAQLTAPLVAGSSWLQPPASLSDQERPLFVDIVTAHDPKHFIASDLPLLCRYVEAAVLADQAAAELRMAGAVIDGKPSPWLTVQEKCTRALVLLSLRLRLSPQARRPNTSGRVRPMSAYDQMRIGDHDDADA